MHEIIIALGSNHDAHNAIASAIERLKDFIYNIQPTRMLDNGSVGFIIPCIFTNALVKGYTELGKEELERQLKLIEKELGRSKEKDSTGIIALDLDLLKYDEVILHANDWNREYIKILFKELG